VKVPLFLALVVLSACSVHETQKDWLNRIANYETAIHAPARCSIIDAYGRPTATPCFPEPKDCKLMTHVCRCPSETQCYDVTIQTPRPTSANLSREIAINLDTGKCFRAGSGPYFGTIVPTACPHTALSLAQMRERVRWQPDPHVGDRIRLMDGYPCPALPIRVYAECTEFKKHGIVIEKDAPDLSTDKDSKALREFVAHLSWSDFIFVLVFLCYCFDPHFRTDDSP
jgi:hypothetical protein